MEALRYYCKNREGSQCGGNVALIIFYAVRIDHLTNELSNSLK